MHHIVFHEQYDTLDLYKVKIHIMWIKFVMVIVLIFVV